MFLISIPINTSRDSMMLVKYIVFILSIFLYTPSYAAIPQLHANSWNFIKHALIDKPKQMANRTLNKIATIGTTLSILGASSWIILKIFPLSEDEDDQFSEEPILTNQQKLALSIISGILESTFIYYCLYKYQFNHYEKTLFTEFIEHWVEYKQHTPQDLHPACDILYNLYHKHPDRFKKEMADALEIIKKTIHEHMLIQDNSLYRTKDLFTHNRLSTTVKLDFNSILKGITRVFKLVK